MLPLPLLLLYIGSAASALLAALAPGGCRRPFPAAAQMSAAERAPALAVLAALRGATAAWMFLGSRKGE